jgi:membrane protease YdiL (CAAX protease family)
MQNLARFPLAIRVVPFLIFLGLTFGQGACGEASRYWFYAAKTVVGAVMLWVIWPSVAELRWHFSWEAVAAGCGVFVLWIGSEGWYPDLFTLQRDYLCPLFKKIGLESLCSKNQTNPLPWNPHTQFGPGLAWAFVVVRLLGSAVIVPPLEELFYRSFVYRYLVKPDFQSVPLGLFRWWPFFLTSLVFGLSHREWLAGILCGFVYQGLVCYTKRLGDAMVAHALTNALLGGYVIVRGAWHFW